MSAWKQSERRMALQGKTVDNLADFLKRAYLPNKQSEEINCAMLKDHFVVAGHLAVNLDKGVAAGLGEPLTWQQCLQSLCSQWRFRPYLHLHHTGPLRPLNDSIQQQNLHFRGRKQRQKRGRGEAHSH